MNLQAVCTSSSMTSGMTLLSRPESISRVPWIMHEPVLVCSTEKPRLYFIALAREELGVLDYGLVLGAAYRGVAEVLCGLRDGELAPYRVDRALYSGHFAHGLGPDAGAVYYRAGVEVGLLRTAPVTRLPSKMRPVTGEAFTKRAPRRSPRCGRPGRTLWG